MHVETTNRGGSLKRVVHRCSQCARGFRQDPKESCALLFATCSWASGLNREKQHRRQSSSPPVTHCGLAFVVTMGCDTPFFASRLPPNKCAAYQFILPCGRHLVRCLGGACVQDSCEERQLVNLKCAPPAAPHDTMLGATRARHVAKLRSRHVTRAAQFSQQDRPHCFCPECS